MAKMTKGKSFDRLLVRARHIDPWIDGRAPGAYVGLLVGTSSRSLHGYGWITNTEGLFARCCDEAINKLLIEDADSHLEIIAENDGFRRYLEEYVPKWIHAGDINSQGKEPDQYEVWKKLYVLYLLRGRISVRNRANGEYKVEFDDLKNRLNSLCQRVNADIRAESEFEFVYNSDG